MQTNARIASKLEMIQFVSIVDIDSAESVPDWATQLYNTEQPVRCGMCAQAKHKDI
jgi:hypothetical protein